LISAGIIAGVLFGLYAIAYLKRRIKNGYYILSTRSDYSPPLIIGISISLFFIIVPLISRGIYELITVPLVIASWIGIAVSFLWLINHERKNSPMLMTKE